MKPIAIIGQTILYGAFAAFIGYFATAPRYQHLPPDKAVVKLSISHLGGRECRKRTPEELAKLPQNMRAPLDCPRERSPIALELDMDGQSLFKGQMQPTGVAKDGIATIYRRFEVPAGEHTLAVRLNDNLRQSGFPYSKEAQVTLKPAQILVVDFNPDRGGLFFQ
ncbi:hypothetical protein B9N43_08235 [Denitratisoma sp. DHT3]|uniref:hypothetical protein n=1 Tax=Denitratisoma sp. DHT3 TaxID=1981880 RepID=UPI0011989244|nr:hypothetical protein [Denitratisoma sp. DHT3]QDX81227.1 hypothetical protein B9N43_08235 [Denitratisoma sp. DHT3]